MRDSITSNIVAQDTILAENNEKNLENQEWFKDPDAADSPSPVSVLDTLSPEMQSQMVGHILNDVTCLSAAAKSLEPSAFTVDAHKMAVEIALDYFHKYAKAIPKPLLMELLKERANGRKDLPVILTIIGSIEYLTFESQEYWIERITELGSRAKIGKAFREFTKEQNYEKLWKSLDEARQVSKSAEFELFSPDELNNLDGLEWMIEGHFPKTATVCVFGSSGAGKSFVCLDMALSIATGMEFLGSHLTKRGRVLYINSEGSYNLKSRYAAWCAGHSVDQVANIIFSTVSHNLQDRSEVEKLIKKATARLGGIDVVFVDTLSRNFGPGDTDKNSDMQAYLRSVDLIRERTGAAVVNVHHTGWSDAERERGAKSLRDYCDTSICVAKEGQDQIEVSCKKQKDAAEFEPYRLQKMPAAGSLYLRLLGSKSQLKQEESSVEAETSLGEFLSVIPDLALSVEETEANTVTAKQLMEATGLSTGKISQQLNDLLGRGQIQRRKFEASSRSPMHYWRRSEISI